MKTRCSASLLGERPVSAPFQLPPNCAVDAARLEAFFELLSAKRRCSFAFRPRHESRYTPLHADRNIPFPPVLVPANRRFNQPA
jgi:uncharacterized protein YecE (DUF72 family)